LGYDTDTTCGYAIDVRVHHLRKQEKKMPDVYQISLFLLALAFGIELAK